MKLFVATKAFIMHEGRLLLIRESSHYSDGSNAARFDVPGGRVEPGQRFDESLRREVREETGLDVQVGQPFHVDEWRPVVRGEQWQVVGVYFACTAASDQVELGGDHDTHVWILPQEYKQHEIIPNLEGAFRTWQQLRMD
jgi:8-oxo-dGTP diphosphatase